ncbi:type III PLP-dependent enzyme [Methylobacterium gnaphalii]|uniref:Diaminopimelate decarboxylase n=1 Tax=Methylobacterium gnaphalii TaxID=1010610 RepID=A0A512JFV6_9HYPH|nr:type III PLP-dependent enzyme [Methylobacterium gnaphalii]GEP08834.1 diaminopimelate decarboxylase [Methylobacterium gnaphalii]GJD69919.1 L-glutamyl-[BtrI acyl-carrier protein] decarboxylase [Methylobacterium gnaphalii]GLS47599.1 diaminopimelate decarboxylase [Methylobacterium gnaphalii]
MPQPDGPAPAEQLADLFGSVAGELAVGGVPLSALAEHHGTPLYVYDAERMRRIFRALSEAVAGFADIYYSIKANPNPAVARVFVREGAGLEIASAAEYLAACAAGAASERILFAGPGKRLDELAFVIERGIGEIHLESHEEIARVAAIGQGLGVTVPVALRINPSAAAQGGAMRMGGKPSPFGFDEEEIKAVIEAVTAHPALRLTGIHLFAGTQILDADVLAGQWGHGLQLASRAARHLGQPLETIDLGGGLGIPYFQGETALDLGRLRERVDHLAAYLRDDPLIRDARVLIEPGRFLVGPAGLYAGQVLASKMSRGTRFLVIDGGMHHHLAASGNLGQVIKRDFPIVAAAPAGREASPCTLVGPLCTPLDTLARQAALPDLHAGELVAILQSGAYGLTASPIGFLSHPTPAEVLVDRGSVTLIRPRGTFEAPIASVVTSR